MKRRLVFVAAVFTVGLLLITILVFAARQLSPAITIHHVKSVRGESGVRFVTFGVTNHSDRSCIVRPVSVEVRHGSSWERCFEFPLPSGPVVSHLGTSQGGHIKSGQDLGPNPLLGPHEYCSSTLELKNLPLGSPLRLKVGVSKELPALEGLFRRLDLRFRRGVKGIPFNPFNKSSRLRLYSKEAPTVSEEFIEPDSNPVSQGNSER